MTQQVQVFKNSKVSYSNLIDRYRDSSIRLNVARSLSSRRDELSRKATDYLWKKSGDMPDSSKQKCMRDIEYLIRLITYGLVSNSTQVVDEYLLNGFKETYSTIGFSLDTVVRAMEFLRENHELPPEEALEADRFINHVIRALSR